MQTFFPIQYFSPFFVPHFEIPVLFRVHCSTKSKAAVVFFWFLFLFFLPLSDGKGHGIGDGIDLGSVARCYEQSSVI